MKQLLIFTINTIAIILLMKSSLFSSKIDELDKPPEGAHEGQILLGVSVSIGLAFGAPVDAENNFLKNSTYTFSETDITKELIVNHLAFSTGINFEYIFINHLGIRTTINKTMIIQRTRFGANHENWNEILYSNYTIQLGPAFHLTTRKQWDVTLNPFIGYSFGTYRATPVASTLIDDYKNNKEISVNGLTYGSELNFTAYFTGGLYITLGVCWTANTIDYSSKTILTNPQTNRDYSLSAATLHSINFIFSVGYAFSN